MFRSALRYAVPHPVHVGTPFLPRSQVVGVLHAYKNTTKKSFQTSEDDSVNTLSVVLVYGGC